MTTPALIYEARILAFESIDGLADADDTAVMVGEIQRLQVAIRKAEEKL